MYTTRGCTPGVPTVYPYPQYPWLTQPEGRRVRVLTGTGTGQPGITQGLPVLIPISSSVGQNDTNTRHLCHRRICLIKVFRMLTKTLSHNTSFLFTTNNGTIRVILISINPTDTNSVTRRG